MPDLHQMLRLPRKRTLSTRTMSHTCHVICTLLPLDAALTIWFATNTKHDTSLKRCACREKNQVIFRRPCTSILHTMSYDVIRNDFQHYIRDLRVLRSATPCHACLQTTLRPFSKPRMRGFAASPIGRRREQENHDKRYGSLTTSILHETLQTSSI